MDVLYTGPKLEIKSGPGSNLFRDVWGVKYTSLDLLSIPGPKPFPTLGPDPQKSHNGDPLGTHISSRNFWTPKSIETEGFWIFLWVSDIPGVRKLRWRCVRIAPEVF